MEVITFDFYWNLANLKYFEKLIAEPYVAATTTIEARIALVLQSLIVVQMFLV